MYMDGKTDDEKKNLPPPPLSFSITCSNNCYNLAPWRTLARHWGGFISHCHLIIRSIVLVWRAHGAGGWGGHHAVWHLLAQYGAGKDWVVATHLSPQLYPYHIVPDWHTLRVFVYEPVSDIPVAVSKTVLSINYILTTYHQVSQPIDGPVVLG